MQFYHVAMIVAAFIALAASWRTPRAKWWIASLAGAYTISLAYLYAGKPDIGIWWPPQPGIVFLCDAAIILAIWHWGEERWEQYGLRMVLMLSATLDLVQTFSMLLGFPPPMPQRTFGIALEIINYLALLTITGVGIADMLGGSHERRRHYLHGAAGRAVRAARDFAHARSGPHRPLTKW